MIELIRALILLITLALGGSPQQATIKAYEDQSIPKQVIRLPGYTLTVAAGAFDSRGDSFTITVRKR